MQDPESHFARLTMYFWGLLLQTNVEEVRRQESVYAHGLRRLSTHALLATTLAYDKMSTAAAGLRESEAVRLQLGNTRSKGVENNSNNERRNTGT